MSLGQIHLVVPCAPSPNGTGRGELLQYPQVPCGLKIGSLFSDLLYRDFVKPGTDYLLNNIPGDNPEPVIFILLKFPVICYRMFQKYKIMADQ